VYMDMCLCYDMFVSLKQMYNVLKDMDINYPAYVWTHNGWIQQMDISYNAHLWDTEPLIVHFVPFSHNDPGLEHCLVHSIM